MTIYENGYGKDENEYKNKNDKVIKYLIEYTSILIINLY